jgi:hypothetical protein
MSPPGLLAIGLAGVFLITGLSQVAVGREEATPESDTAGWVQISAPPPAEPPDAFLLAEQRAGSGPVVEALQAGVPVHYQWAVAGTLEAYEVTPPIPWPDPALLSGRKAVVELRTPVMPLGVEVRVYRSLDPNGIPQDQPTLVRCEPGESSEQSCQLKRSEAGNNGTWRVVFPVPAEPGDYFVAVQARWVLPRSLVTPSAAPPPPLLFLASWAFSLGHA